VIESIGGEVFEQNFEALATFGRYLFGLAAPANADVAHHNWVHDIQHQATVSSTTPVFGNGR